MIMKPAAYGVFYDFAVPQVDTVVVPISNHRRTITFIPVQSSLIFYAFGQTAVLNHGIAMSSVQPGIMFRREDIGALIDTEIHAIANTSALRGCIIIGYDDYGT
jgi:hypothetical protein